MIPLTDRWWLAAARGALALAVGIVAVLGMMTDERALVLGFSAFLVLDACVCLALGLGRGPYGVRIWNFAIQAAVNAAAATFLWRALPGRAGLIFVMAAWALAVGTVQLFMAVRLYMTTGREYAVGLAGLAAIAFGAALALSPEATTAWLSSMFGLFAITAGVLTIVAGWRFRAASGEFSHFRAERQKWARSP